MKKKIRAIATKLFILCLVMIQCLGILPTNVFATDAHIHQDECYIQELICDAKEKIDANDKEDIKEQVQEHVHQDACYLTVLNCKEDFLEDDITTVEETNPKEVKEEKQPEVDLKSPKEPNAPIVISSDLDPVDVRFTSNDYLEGQENEVGGATKGIIVNYSFTNDGSTDRKIVISYPKKYAGSSSLFPYEFG